MTTETPKRLAADILRTDMPILTDYWQERMESCGVTFTEAEAEAISEAMHKILAPVYDRLDNIAKDVNVLNRV